MLGTSKVEFQPFSICKRPVSIVDHLTPIAVESLMSTANIRGEGSKDLWSCVGL